ncbi:MAG: NmrA family NAD(P)-binding protein, partial [Flavobacteriaceae bacterium]|nr:NmrA family NAD(P)-binding protein [Flavobacteriaceae bacterium]
MKKILVIGGTGTIGRALVNLLHDHEVHFKVLVRNQEKAKPLDDIGIE